MLRMFNTLTVRVDFPALDSLVAYFRETAAQQAQIDALAADVEVLTTRLRNSSTGLEGAVNKGE